MQQILQREDVLKRILTAQRFDTLDVEAVGYLFARLRGERMCSVLNALVWVLFILVGSCLFYIVESGCAYCVLIFGVYICLSVVCSTDACAAVPRGAGCDDA